MITTVYEPSPVKRRRRTNDQLDSFKEQLTTVLREIHPATVRQLYYQLVTRGIIEKTEPAYKLVVRVATELRRSGTLPFSWLADNTRWMRKPNTWGSLQELLEDTKQLYRRDMWRAMDAYVEVWLEKDALASVVFDATAELDVPLMVTRGYASWSFLHTAAETIREKAKPTFIYYLGDCDPSGIDAARHVEQSLHELANDVPLKFERIGVTEEQIRFFDLPTRPTKTTDSRAKGFAGESVELDALPPQELRELVSGRIWQHVDYRTMSVMKQAEQEERAMLATFARQIGGGK